MNELKVFESDSFGQVRTVIQDGEPWFVAADVCRALEIGATHVALRRLDEDEKGRCLTPTPGGAQEMATVNEPGLYTLVLGSRKPQARAFKRWITHEVIPAIRKTGGYIIGEDALSDDELMARALMIANAKIRQREDEILYLQLDNVALEHENKTLRSKAAYYDQAMDTRLLTGVRETAMLLGITQSQLVNLLISGGYAYRDGKSKLMPYSGAKNKGYFVLKEVRNARTGWYGVQFMFTRDGRLFIEKCLQYK